MKKDMFRDGPSSPNLHSTKKLLNQLFRIQIFGLYKLIEQFGGPQLAERLDIVVQEAAERNELGLIIYQGKVTNLQLNKPWATYKRVMQEAVKFSVSVAGRQLVKERVHIVTTATENKTKTSHFEVAFRLGLHRMNLSS